MTDPLHAIAARRPAARRGNTLVLVTAILVLLVIVATAFLVRSQSGRAQAAAQQKATGREARVEAVASDIAQEVANALFVKRIDQSSMAAQVAANQATGLTGQPLFGEFLARSDYPRLPAEPLALRYGVDYVDTVSNLSLGSVAGGDGYIDGYNFAPFSVNPFTNWPARYGDIPGEGNPIGNPGFGDMRWLASTEPMRALVLNQVQNPVAPAPPNPQQQLPFPANWSNLALQANGAPILSPEGLGFSHWPHLSWLPTAENGFRLCWDISNVEANWDHLPAGTATPTAAQRAVAGELNLGTPYEQWLPFAAPREPTVVGKDTRGYLVLDATDWQGRVREWFNVGITDFNNVPPHARIIKAVNAGGTALPGPAAAGRRAFALPNFLQLGAFGDPSDEFKVNPANGQATSRNLIGRTLADADGDGWTDSFWFVSPSSSDRSTRQLVAVRIMDNSALLNVNIATRSDRGSTIGQTPSDLALATRRESYDETTAIGSNAAVRDPAVGFLNARENDPEYRANFGFSTPLPPPGTSTTLPPAKLVYAVAANAGGPTGGLDVGWAPERWEGRRTQPAAAGATAADSYQSGILRLLGVMQEGAAGQANALAPFFETSADFGNGTSGSVYGDYFALTRPTDRLNYFKAMAYGGEVLDPVTAARIQSLTPFGSDDEVELRAANGLNSPQTVSRLEMALNTSPSIDATQVLPGQFLRSSRSREETSRFLDPDDQRVQDWRARAAWTPGAAFSPRSGAELLLDHRRLLTTVSGARNEMLPPRLWTVVDHTNHPPGLPDTEFVGQVERTRPAYLKRGVDFDLDGTPDDVTGDGAVTLADDLAPYHPNIMFPGATLIPPGTGGNNFGIAIRDANNDGVADVEDFERARRRFLMDNLKIDLRRPNDVPAAGTAANGAFIAARDRKFASDVQRVMRRALIDEGSRQSYFGRPGQGTQEANASLLGTKMMIASMAANVLAYRDGERRVTNTLYLDQPLHPLESIALPPDAVADPTVTNAGFIGVEKQPFLQEVFIAFVYPKTKLTQGEIDAVVGPAGGNATPGCPDPDNCQLSASDPYALPPCTSNGAGEHFVAYDPADPATWPAVVFVAQVANPFNEPVNLADFELRINPAQGGPQRFFFGIPGPAGTKSGNIYGPDVELGPCTPEEPRTAIVFSLPEKFPNGDPFPRDAWLDFLDIGASIDADGNGQVSATEADPANDVKPGQPFPPDANAIFAPAWGGGALEANNRRGGTLYFDATRTTVPAPYPGLDVSGEMSRWKPSQAIGGAPPANSYVELRRAIYPSTGGTPIWTVVDRFENELDPDEAGRAGQRFTDLVNRLYVNAAGGSLPPPPDIQCRAGSLAIDGVRIRDGDYFVTWARGARQWLFDTQNGLPNGPGGTVPPGRGVITPDERTPRYAFARTTGVMASSSPTNGSADRETFVGGTQDGSGRKGEVLATVDPPDGTVANPTAAWINTPYYNLWGEVKRGKPTFLPTRIPETVQSRRYDYPAWRLANATPPSGMTLSYGEKGVTDASFVDGNDPRNFIAPYRFFQKDADFDQAAEFLDVPMWGPLVERALTGRTYATLAEILAQPVDSTATLQFPKFPKPANTNGLPAYGPFQSRYNRLQVEPAQYDTTAPAGGRPTLLSGVQTMPPPVVGPITATTPAQQNGIGFNSRLPGGAALLDAFVVDDRGAQPFDAWTSTSAPDGFIDFNERAAAENRRLRLARNFEGKLTPGLINVNTAPVEVMRAMPQMLRLTYDDDFPITRTADSDPNTLYAAGSALAQRRLVQDPAAWQAAPYEITGGQPGTGNPQSILFDYGVAAPRVRVAEAMELWRNKGNVTADLSNNLFQNMPSYFSRGLDLPDASNHREWAPSIRSERGFDSLGELAVLTKGAEFAPPASSDADGNGTPDVQDIAKGKVADVNRNNINDAVDGAALVGSSWNQAQGWSVRFGGQDPYRTRWDDPTWGAGRSSPIGPGPQAVGGSPLAYRTEGIPESLNAGQRQVFPLTGRTAIDKHLLTVATDDRATGAVVETNNPANDGLGAQFIERKAYRYDQTAGDAIEQNQLLKGISNIVTTRSDVFTVWLRIRTIRQDTLTGLWNGTDPEFIVDDARYMMTIDRSSVDRPGEQPRIVSFVKVPN